MAFLDIALFCVVVSEQFLLTSKANILEHDIEKESLRTIRWMEIYESCDLSVLICIVTQVVSCNGSCASSCHVVRLVLDEVFSECYIFKLFRPTSGTINRIET
jgi:hypothetical protein